MATFARSSPAEPLLPRLAVVACGLLQILTPVLPSLGIGDPIGARSGDARTLITPAGYAFAIWGPLYIGASLFAVYQAMPRPADAALVARLRWPAAGAFLGNALWAAYVQVAGLGVPSVLIIGWTLLCLLTAFRRLTVAGDGIAAMTRWLARVPLSALAAWLTAATIVNVAATLHFEGVDGGAAAVPLAAAILVVAGLIAAVALARSRGNLAFALVFLWALVAILVAGGQRATPIAVAAVAAMLLVVAGAVSGRRRAGAAR